MNEGRYTVELDDLLALLGIDSPSEMVYFEQFADLMEEGQDIPLETLTAFTEGMETGALVELVDGYFEEIQNSVPDGEDELYMLFTNINTTLRTLAISGEDDAAHMFAEELYKFRTWYLFEDRVLCTDLEEGTDRDISPFAALTNYRAQGITGEEYILDFSDALDYPLDDYIVSLTSIIEDDYGNGDAYGEDEDYRDLDEDE